MSKLSAHPPPTVCQLTWVRNQLVIPHTTLAQSASLVNWSRLVTYAPGGTKTTGDGVRK